MRWSRETLEFRCVFAIVAHKRMVEQNLISRICAVYGTNVATAVDLSTAVCLGHNDSCVPNHMD